MGIFDALKGLFGGTKHNESNNSHYPQYPPMNYFIKPDWANEDEDTDDDLVMRHPRNRTNMFSVLSNPLEIHRYFEHQMNEMAKNFEEAFRDPIFSGNGVDSFFGQTPFFKSDQGPAILPPSDDSEGRGSLRDKCLKPDAREQNREVPVDSDLDNEFKNGQLQLFKSPEAPQIHSPIKPHVFSSQIFTRVMRHPDGSVEEVRTKQIGDQKYTKVTRTNSAGQTDIHEDIVNIDESQLKDFQSTGDLPLPRMNGFGGWFRFRL